jgi:hypothetical protein
LLGNFRSDLLKKLEKMAQKQKEETEKDEGTVSEDKPYVSSPVTPRRAKRSVPDTPNRRNRNFSGKNHQTQSESPDPPEPPTPAAKPATGQTIPHKAGKICPKLGPRQTRSPRLSKKAFKSDAQFYQEGRIHRREKPSCARDERQARALDPARYESRHDPFLRGRFPIRVWNEPERSRSYLHIKGTVVLKRGR